MTSTNKRKLFAQQKSFSSSTSSASGNVFLDDETTKWRTLAMEKSFKQPLNQKYLCAVCEQVLLFPVSFPECSHHACNECFNQLTKDKKMKRVCPRDGVSINRREVIVDGSLQDELKNLEVICPMADNQCTWKGRFHALEEHYQVCDYVTMQCPNGCGFQCLRSMMPMHMKSQCSKRTIKCEFCTRQFFADLEIEHLKHCTKLPVACPQSCGIKDLSRDEMENHLENECPLHEANCPFQLFGCNYSCIRRDLTPHVDSCFKDHLEKLCDGVRKHHIKIESHEMLIRQLEQSSISQQNKLNRLTMDRNVIYLWKIENWNKKRDMAAMGKCKVLSSLPFYTARHQYKMLLNLFPNGDGKALGKGASMFVRILQGDYDALLTWPFPLTLIMSLVDQSTNPLAGVDHVYKLKPNLCKENRPFLKRPTTGANPSFGVMNFFDHSLLDERSYVKDDTIFIRVEVNYD